MARIRVEILSNTSVRGNPIQAGKSIWLDQSDAKRLIQLKRAKEVINPGQKSLVKEEKPKSAVPGSNFTAPENNNGDENVEPEISGNADNNKNEISDDDKILLIADEIEKLDPENEEHFTNQGKPDANVLTSRLGFQVSKAMRDEAESLLNSKNISDS